MVFLSWHLSLQLTLASVRAAVTWHAGLPGRPQRVLQCSASQPQTWASGWGHRARMREQRSAGVGECAWIHAHAYVLICTGICAYIHRGICAYLHRHMCLYTPGHMCLYTPVYVLIFSGICTYKYRQMRFIRLLMRLYTPIYALKSAGLCA